ncbi:MAG: hypothetical protein EAZ08_08095 [Cytophagales bacterium]|nr:MAG: hypothetical protein EAZ08_08095 [Cytophagales bacterium]
MKLYESKFQRIYYDKQFSIMEFRWLLPASERDEEELGQEEAMHIELLTKYKPLRVMSDVHNIHFIDVNHLADWVQSEYLKIAEYAPTEAKLRMAVLAQAEMSKQLFKSEEEEQALVEKKLPQIQYFTDEVNAELWLLGEERV